MIIYRLTFFGPNYAQRERDLLVIDDYISNQIALKTYDIKAIQSHREWVQKNPDLKSLWFIRYSIDENGILEPGMPIVIGNQ